VKFLVESGSGPKLLDHAVIAVTLMSLDHVIITAIIKIK
jgi:hypothetical protein